MTVKISINIEGYGSMEIPSHTRLGEVLQSALPDKFALIVAARVNNSLAGLHTEINAPCQIQPVFLTEEAGQRIYQNSLLVLLARAVRDILPQGILRVKHSLGNAVYGEIEMADSFLKDSDVEAIASRMWELVNANEPFLVSKTPLPEARQIFIQNGMLDKYELLQFWPQPDVPLVNYGSHPDIALTPLVPEAGYLKAFNLRYYLPGFILEMPRREDPLRIPPYVEQGKLANVFYESEKWNKIIHADNICELNKIFQDGGAKELILVAEAFQEKKLAQIADRISQNIDRIRIVLIAGPSSSGKTTFARRLSVQLKVNGINPVAISLDDYFVDREQTPRDENGEYDFECLEAIDRQLFNDHLIKLIQGDEVEIPSYNFKTGRREYHGHRISLKPQELIIIEGIHGLNDRLTASIPQGRKFKIYVSALTHLNIDNTNRMHTTDVRAIRRMVRDNSHRGYSARETLERWPSVRRGEEKHIFPFQESADVMFNSALPYELAVLKNFALPLLQQVTPESRAYAEAVRLKQLLDLFVTISPDLVPSNSILREFIGESCFY
ncbi:nucleoside kinase [Desulfurispora thermophila]|uniref:nucleoside kinase n=1 Tax=Desulfurispora thermophila TaxID=265470 RepID=UPI00037FB310|nr:nucleoside kinase [Desulfurispora thermophila]